MKGKAKDPMKGIESFWGLVKVRLSQLRGVDKKTFYLYSSFLGTTFINHDKAPHPFVIVDAFYPPTDRQQSFF